ncbi:hypothetical protein K491DRAFT_313272 [Lophiostoma macrostomum CBS 122681]|uniref:Fungal N-terminal domain-containing protein n=1 Tax=Lophiostoma macrostomum CBS 122681 TaxID=1314788 RepID=A0A6A6SHZ4_9PLEO|nr:hypothetical protein K491DRAFT_313272 [Lophiostoma macrostomum CBS 122681]
MDPISILSLTATLITIGDTVLKVSKGIVVLRRQYLSAPERLARLHRDVDNLQALITAILAQVLPSEGATDYPQTLWALCQTFTKQLQQDLDDLQNIVDRVNRKCGLGFGRDFRQRKQYILSEEVITGFQGRISTHVGYLGFVQSLIREHKATVLQQDIKRILDQTSGILSITSSHIAPKYPSTPRHIIEDHHSIRHRPFRLSHQDCSSSSYNFGFGSLIIEHRHQPWEDTITSDRVNGQRRVAISFVPACWFSRTSLWVTLDLAIVATPMSIPLGIYLRPEVINNNPELAQAIYGMDITRLRTLFASNKARPLDLIVDPVHNEPISLLDVGKIQAIHPLPSS